MGEFIGWVVLLTVIGGALYYFVTTAYTRAVARHRSEKWVVLRFTRDDLERPKI